MLSVSTVGEGTAATEPSYESEFRVAVLCAAIASLMNLATVYAILTRRNMNVGGLWPYFYLSLPLILASIAFLFFIKNHGRAGKLVFVLYLLTWIGGIGGVLAHQTLTVRGYLEKVRIVAKDGSVREVYRVLEFPYMEPKRPFDGRP